MEEYNILVLGKIQSGKSTLIEYMRKCANPKVEINTRALGAGFSFSYTRRQKPQPSSPTFQNTMAKRRWPWAVICGKHVREIDDEYNYVDALNMRRGLVSKKGTPQLTQKVKFNLIDTSGLNTTCGDVEMHVQGIFGGLVAVKTICLPLITISSSPFTQGLKTAIKDYVDMFPALNGIIAFVHTHFDYKYFHPQRFQASHAVDLRTENLDGIMGRTTYPHFKMSCDYKPHVFCWHNYVNIRLGKHSKFGVYALYLGQLVFQAIL